MPVEQTFYTAGEATQYLSENPDLQEFTDNYMNEKAAGRSIFDDPAYDEYSQEEKDGFESDMENIINQANAQGISPALKVAEIHLQTSPGTIGRSREESARLRGQGVVSSPEGGDVVSSPEGGDVVSSPEGEGSEQDNNQSLALQSQIDSLSSQIANLPQSIPQSQYISTTTTAPPIDYSRIQGFLGTPEIRDQQGNITQQATGVYAQPQGLMAARESIGTAGKGQPDTLFKGQAALGSGQAVLGAGQEGLMAGQRVLGEGIGTPTEDQPQTLFGGQMALGTGQAGIQSGVSGLGRDLGSLSGSLSDFERAQRAYQSAAESQRAQGREIGMTTREQMEAQLRTVGSQTNRIAEEQARRRQQGLMGQPAQTQQPIQVPQAQLGAQAAQIAGQNLRNYVPQQGGMMGPSGPVAIDPRDQVRYGPTRSPV